MSILSWFRKPNRLEEAGISPDFVRVEDLSPGPINLCSTVINERMLAWVAANPPRYPSGDDIHVRDHVLYHGKPAIVMQVYCTALHGARWQISVQDDEYYYNCVSEKDLTLIKPRM